MVSWYFVFDVFCFPLFSVCCFFRGSPARQFHARSRACGLRHCRSMGSRGKKSEVFLNFRESRKVSRNRFRGGKQSGYHSRKNKSEVFFRVRGSRKKKSDVFLCIRGSRIWRTFAEGVSRGSTPSSNSLSPALEAKIHEI